MLARLSGGISPAALLLAYTDWLSHLAASPQRQIEIAQEALVDTKRFLLASGGHNAGIVASPAPAGLSSGRGRVRVSMPRQEQIARHTCSQVTSPGTKDRCRPIT